MGLNTGLAAAFSLGGKVAVVTGAASGMGQEAARILALAGAHVVATDIDETGLAVTCRIVRESGGDISSHRLDVSRREDVEALADSVVADTGRLDVWINCAGVSFLHSILDTKPEEAERTIAVNMLGVYWGCIAVYGMTKAAVNSLTWTSAAEFGPFGVRVNAVAPGWIDTPMVTKLFRNPSGEIDAALRDKVVSEMASHSPLGRVGHVTDVAHALLYLASDASSFVTGQVLAVNGGASG